MEKRSELLTALLDPAWRGLGRSLAATAGPFGAPQGGRRTGIEMLIRAANDAGFLAEVS
jgi:hypothetical protein